MMTIEETTMWLVGLLARYGIHPGSERYEVCNRAVRYLGYVYQRSEELADGKSVDCSTLISQSYWEGALIGVPFTAEGQRKASSGMSVCSIDEALPGDVLVKYASVADSPDKQWNHVGLYLGVDESDIRWAIESVGGQGVRLTKVEDFNPQGGIKRFVLREEPVSHPRAASTLLLATRIPKFGRLGVRQYRHSGEPRQVHRGLDIYVLEGTEVRATIDGRITIFRNLTEHADGVEIRSSDGTSARYMMLESNAALDGLEVRVGTPLGIVRRPAESSDIVYSDAVSDPSHLHLEFRRLNDTRPQLGNQFSEDGWTYFNHLYLSKIGELPLPFDGI